MIGSVTIDGDEFAPSLRGLRVALIEAGVWAGRLGGCDTKGYMYSARRRHGKLLECGVEVVGHLLETTLKIVHRLAVDGLR